MSAVRCIVLIAMTLISCTTISPQQGVEESVPQAPSVVAKKPKYAVGDCLMIVDLPSGKTESPYRVKIEKIEANVYWYRWLLDNGHWAVSLSCLRRGNDPCWEFESLEKISQKVEDCPHGN